jgi:murein DD-endopeptidase MepM/ murein hydrolase activator NlpD
MNTVLPTSAGKVAHVTGPFGEKRKTGPHKGVDFNYHGGQTGINLTNPTVHSPVDGTVEFVGGDYGTISIREADKNLHQILHTDSQSVQAGQKVSVGNPIGTMGNKGPKGSKYDQHVHYQIKDSKGKIINPEYFWDNQAENNSGKADQPNQSAKPITKQGTSDTYEVKSGDALGTIASKHGTSVKDIMQANPGITNPNAIKVGQKIKIPGKEKVAAASAPKSGGSGANVTINDRTAVHAGSQGVLTTVDVCWTKVGKPVVPIPYTNIALSTDASKTASTVFINGQPVCNQKSIFAKSAGDEPGSRKGVASGTIKGKAEFVTGSPNVLIEGIPAVRQNDLMVSNNGNTAPMPLSQPGAPRAKEVKTEKIEELDETELPNEVPLTVSGGALHIQHDLVGYSINVSDGGQQTQQQQKLEPQQKAALPEPGKAKPVLPADEQKATIKEGQITFDAEGNDIPSSPYFSRMIHWPGNELSGVTLGRGYDMGSRSESEIYNHMIAAGVDTAQASKISQAHGLKGNNAKQFATTNKKNIGEISRNQQILLFNLIYPGYVNRAIANYNSWTSDEPGRIEWSGLKQVIKDVLVDFVYQGFTKGPNPMKAGMNNDVNKLISYIENTPAISQYEGGRHRADYLRNNK